MPLDVRTLEPEQFRLRLEDANNLSGLVSSANGKCLADHARVAAEPRLPELVGENRGLWRRGALGLLRRSAARSTGRTRSTLPRRWRKWQPVFVNKVASEDDAL